MRALATQAKRFPDFDLFALDVTGLDDRDAAFAHALYDQVVRRWITLRGLIETKLNDPGRIPTPPAVAALLAGAAQILLLDKVPVHSAVDTSVEWAKTNGGLGAGRMVNAVLRTIASMLPEEGKLKKETYEGERDELPLADGSALVLVEWTLPADPLQRLSIATSTPIELLRSWSKHYGLREARRLAMHGLMSPPIIFNTMHAAAELPQSLTPHTAPGHHVFTGPHAELIALLSARRDIWVQDPASTLAVAAAAHLNPKLVVDACAGMGTKTRQLAATFPSARVICADVDMIRVKALRDAVAHLPNVEVTSYERLADHAGEADLVLLDVPCSNTGVLARRVEARYRFDREHLEGLAAAQRQIIADSVRLLRRGGGSAGRILYSTCSLEPSENTDQAAWASRWHALRPAREHQRLPEGVPGDGPEKYSDGSYAVILE